MSANNSSGMEGTRRRSGQWCNDVVLVGSFFVLAQVFLFYKQFLSPTTRGVGGGEDSSKTGNFPDVELWTTLQDTTQELKASFSSSSSSSSFSSSSTSRQTRVADGYFNGYPIYFQELEPNQSVYSQIHCVGETYPNQIASPDLTPMQRKLLKNDWTWMYRSCHFHFFCFDVSTNKYIVYQNPHEETFLPFLQQRPSMDVSQSFLFHNPQPTAFLQRHNASFAVSIGGINTKWTLEGGIPRMRWFPEVRKGPPPRQFYTLPPQVVLVPFHSLAAFNPGHLVWDDFLPIYTLLTLFQLHQPLQYEVLMMRYVLDGKGVWAGCDWKAERSEECIHMLAKFGPLMNPNINVKILPHRQVNFTIPFSPPGASPHIGDDNSRSQKRPPTLVCAKQGAAGLGPLTDHGTMKGHGWEQMDYQIVHNAGRGGLFWDFRNYMLTNVGLTQPHKHTIHQLSQPYKIIFSTMSSKQTGRSNTFSEEINILKKGLDPQLAVVESHTMKTYSLREQAELVKDAAIYVTGCGGGAVTAIFLPKGASLLVYYLERGGLESNRATKKPARLDWDMLNNLGYVRTHWIGQGTRTTQEDRMAFLRLVQYELELIQRESKLDTVRQNIAPRRDRKKYSGL